MLFAGSRSVTDNDGCAIGSLNVTTTGSVTETPVEPAAGVADTTDGAFVSGGGVLSNTTSTQ